MGKIITRAVLALAAVLAFTLTVYDYDSAAGASIGWGPHQVQQAGQFCADADHLEVQQADNGRFVVCVQDEDGDSWRWRPTLPDEPVAGAPCPDQGLTYEDLTCERDRDSNGERILVWKLVEQPDSPSPSPAAVPNLPLTGVPTLMLGGAGLILLGVGGGAIWLARRRPIELESTE